MAPAGDSMHDCDVYCAATEIRASNVAPETQTPESPHRYRRRRRDDLDEMMSQPEHNSAPKPSRRRGLRHKIPCCNVVRFARPIPIIIILACFSMLHLFSLGWSPPTSPISTLQKHHRSISILTPPVSWNCFPPRSRIKGIELWASGRQPIQSSALPPMDYTHSNKPPAAKEPKIILEINQQTELLAQCLHVESSNGRLSSQPIQILKKIMSIYRAWISADRPRFPQLIKASAAIDWAFRLVTNEAFSTPYRLDWVNLGMEALRLQLHSGHFYQDEIVNGGASTKINGDTGRIRLVSLQRPYDAIPKGTWLKALRALTSNDVNSSHSPPVRSVRSLSLNGQQWITPSNAAFRILKRLVTSKGVRTFYKKKIFPKQGGGGHQQQKQLPSLDERDFNMVLHAYATHAKPEDMRSAHRVIALQERTPRAPPLSPVTYSILLKAYGRQKDVENVEMSLLHAQRNGVVPDIVMANTVLDAYVNCGMLNKAQDMFRSMTKGVREDDNGGYWPLLRENSRTYNTLLKGMAEEGDLRGAMKLSRKVEEKGLWDDITTNTLVNAAVTAHEFHVAEDLLANHTASPEIIARRRWRGKDHPEINKRRKWKGDHPNVEAYTELLDGYAKDGQLENALRVMQEMQTRGVLPNEYTYTCMVWALARKKKVRQARKMINYAASTLPSMKGGNNGRNALTPTYNAFISGLMAENKGCADAEAGQSSHAADVVEVLAVLQEMQDQGIHPNAVTVGLTVDGLGRCNPPRIKEAWKLVHHLQSRTRVLERQANTNCYYNSADVGDNEGNNAQGISLSNNKIATGFIVAYGRAGDIASATKVFDQIQTPDVVAFNALLEAYCRCDELKLALDLFENHVARKDAEIQIKPDVVTYTSLISRLLQLKSQSATRRAKNLYKEMKKRWYILPDTILVDTILAAMIGDGSVGFKDEDVKFTLSVLRDGSCLEWEGDQYEKRKRAVRSILSCSSDIWKTDEFAFDLMKEPEPEDPLFTKKGWNTIDSGFRLWGGGGNNHVVESADGEGDNSPVDSFLASKGWNNIDSGFRLL